MKKKLLAIASCISILSLSTIAYSAERPYFSGNLGLTMLDDYSKSGGTHEFDSGLGLGFAIGYEYGNIRLEGEFAYQENDMDRISAYGRHAKLNGDISSSSLLFNGYFDFKNTTAFTPYLSAGLGIAYIDKSSGSVEIFGQRDYFSSRDDTVFAYQFGAGFGYTVNRQITLDLKYRYFGTSDPDVGITGDMDYESHNIYAGIRFSF